jgi:hypothetical protein
MEAMCAIWNESLAGASQNLEMGTSMP